MRSHRVNEKMALDREKSTVRKRFPHLISQHPPNNPCFEKVAARGQASYILSPLWPIQAPLNSSATTTCMYSFRTPPPSNTILTSRSPQFLNSRSKNHAPLPPAQPDPRPQNAALIPLRARRLGTSPNTDLGTFPSLHPPVRATRTRLPKAGNESR